MSALVSSLCYVTSFNAFCLDTHSEIQTIDVSLKGATATSLWIEWNLKNNTSCEGQSRITIVYTRLTSCQRTSASKSDEELCNPGETYNISRIAEGNSTKIEPLFPNSSYRVAVEIVPLMCEEFVWRTFSVFNTLDVGKYHLRWFRNSE